MIEIRKAYPTDAYTLVKIRDSVWKQEFYDILPNGIIYDRNRKFEESVRHLQDQINENNRILVALDNDKMVGFIFYAKTQSAMYDSSAEIREIYILQEYQKQGIGKELFQQAVENLKQLGFRSLIVNCPAKSRGLNFFLHLGGIDKETITEKMLGYSVICEVIYFDIVKDNVNKENTNDWNELYIKAQDKLPLLNELNREIAILLSENNNLYSGLGIKNKVCPIESALSNMYLGGDKKISKILILNKKSQPVLPCGKCRDLLIDLGQEKASILFDYGSLKTMTLKELNPYYKDEERA